MDRLHRMRLLFGDVGVEKLKKATVMVVGCGAVGSFAIEGLARSGVGRLIVVDFDVVEESNINRQLFAVGSTVGKNKVDVAQNRIFDVNPDIMVHRVNVFWDDATDIDVVPNFIVDAIDSVESKVALYKWAHAHNVPLITSMGAASKTDPAQIKIAPISKTSVCPLASRVRRLVRGAGLPDYPAVFSTETPAPVVGHAKNLGSIITITGTFGLMMANYIIREIIRNK